MFLCLLTAMCSGIAVPAGAAELLPLPPGFLIGDQDGISLDEHGRYYVELLGVLPGEVYRKTITIQNYETSGTHVATGVPYRLHMTAEPVSKRGPLDLFDEVDVVLKLDGALIYEGSISGYGAPDMSVTPLDLGEYAVGDRAILEATFTVSATLPPHPEISEAIFHWAFYASRTVEVQPPQTGVLETFQFLLPVGGVLLLFGVLVILKKRREQKTAN